MFVYSLTFIFENENIKTCILTMFAKKKKTHKMFICFY